MAKMTRRTAMMGLTGVTVGLGVGAVLAQPRFRSHTATQSKPLELAAARHSAGRNQVSIRVVGQKRVIEANGIPDHAVGQFPNGGNPHRIRAQTYRFEMPLSPVAAGGGQQIRGPGPLTGVAVNGVPFDPGAAEFWQGNPRSGWNYDALGGAVPLGLDANYGHVQPTGAYHYHGLPVGLMQSLGWRSSAASPLMGWAADGFPIYALTARVGGIVRQMRSSYRLKSGRRNGGPGGAHDGTFVQDYVFVAGAGDLDAHNGATVRTSEYPNGTYAYFLTSSFPVIPRSLAGVADRSFQKRRPA